MTSPINNHHRPKLPINRPLPPPPPPVELQVPEEINVDEKINEYKDNFASGKITPDEFINKMKELGINVTMSEDGTTATFKYNGKDYSITSVKSDPKVEEETHQVRHDVNVPPFSYFIQTINSKGQVLKNEWYDLNGELSEVNIFEYDENGNQIKQEWYDENGELEQRVILEYDENGNNIRQSHYDNLSWSVTEYDEQHRKTIYYGGKTNGVTDFSHIYNYGENGKLESVDHKNKDGKIISKDYYDENDKRTSTLYYNEEGQWYKQTDYDENGQVERYHEVTYDENGNIVTATDKDKNGNVIQTITFDEQGRHLNTVDGNGELLLECVYNEDGSHTRTQYKNGEISGYDEFDSQGRWTLIQWYNDNGEIDTVTSFEYFDNGTYSRIDRTPDGKVKSVTTYNENNEELIRHDYSDEVVTKDVVADSDRLFYRLEHGDMSALDELRELGAQIKEEGNYIEVTFDGRTGSFGLNETPEVNEALEQIEKITQKFYLGTKSFEECCKELESIGAELTYNSDGSVDFELVTETFGIWGRISPESAGIFGNCTEVNYNYLKELGLTDSQIEEYFYREECTTTFQDGSKNKDYSYTLREDATVNGKPVTNIRELVTELNKMTDEEALEFNDLCYQLEKGDPFALKKLKAKGIDVKVTSSSESETIYEFEYKGKKYSIWADNPRTEAGQFHDCYEEILARYDLGLMSFDEYRKHLKHLGAEVEYSVGEDGIPEIHWRHEKGSSGYSKYRDNTNTTSATFDSLRVCGLTTSQIQKYFHREENNDGQYNYDTYVLNDNIKIIGKPIKSIKELIEMLFKLNNKPPAPEQPPQS